MKDNKYQGNELKYLEQVLNSERWSSTEGNWVYNLEQQFSKKFGAKYAVAANSGTATLHMALVALGVGPGDEVITPAITVIMDTSCILHCGAMPVYADINPYSINIDPEDVRKKITSKTKAIIAVSLYGCPCDMDELMEISRDYNIPIIEDNAQHMGKHRAHISSYSFENSKHLSCGEGGVVITDNEEWARTMRLFGNHGFKNSMANSGRTKLNLDVFQNPFYKRHSNIGWNYRLSEFNAAIALAQLEKVDEIVERRREIGKKFRECFEIYGDYFVCQKDDPEHTYWTFVVRMSTVFLCRWFSFRNKFIENGGHGYYGCWSVPYREPAVEKFIDKEIKCPKAEAVQRQIIQFKLNFRDEEKIEREIEALKKTLEEIFVV